MVVSYSVEKLSGALFTKLIYILLLVWLHCNNLTIMSRTYYLECSHKYTRSGMR